MKEEPVYSPHDPFLWEKLGRHLEKAAARCNDADLQAALEIYRLLKEPKRVKVRLEVSSEEWPDSLIIPESGEEIEGLSGGNRP